MNSNGLIEVSASGVAHAPYELAFFCITVSHVAESGGKAKAGMKKTLDSLIDGIEALIQSGRVRNKVMALRVDPHEEFDRVSGRNANKGYKASCKVTFETPRVEMVGQIQDALTEYPQSRVASVEYGFESIEQLRVLALEKAWENVQKRWHSQIRTLGLDASDYKIHSWRANYNEHQRISKVSAPEGDTDPGVAAVGVSLDVYYQDRQRA